LIVVVGGDDISLSHGERVCVCFFTSFSIFVVNLFEKLIRF